MRIKSLIKENNTNGFEPRSCNVESNMPLFYNIPAFRNYIIVSTDSKLVRILGYKLYFACLGHQVNW